MVLRYIWHGRQPPRDENVYQGWIGWRSVIGKPKVPLVKYGEAVNSTSCHMVQKFTASEDLRKGLWQVNSLVKTETHNLCGLLAQLVEEVPYTVSRSRGCKRTNCQSQTGVWEMTPKVQDGSAALLGSFPRGRNSARGPKEDTPME